MASFAQLNALANSIAVGKYVVMGKDGETPYFFEIKDVKSSHRIYRLQGNPGDYVRHTVNTKWQSHALTTIANDVQKAIVLYGKHAKFCGACDSALTHPRSLAACMGPVCAPRWGVKW